MEYLNLNKLSAIIAIHPNGFLTDVTAPARLPGGSCRWMTKCQDFGPLDALHKQ